MPWMSDGIDRRSNGLKWDLSGKPTKENHPEVVLVFLGGLGRNLPEPRILNLKVIFANKVPTTAY